MIHLFSQFWFFVPRTVDLCTAVVIATVASASFSTWQSGTAQAQLAAVAREHPNVESSAQALWRPRVSRGLAKLGGNTLIMGDFHVEIFPRPDRSVEAIVTRLQASSQRVTPDLWRNGYLVIRMMDSLDQIQEATLDWNATSKRYEGRFSGHHNIVSGPMSVELNLANQSLHASVGGAAALPPALFSGKMMGVGRYAFEVVISNKGVLRLIPRTRIMPHVLKDFEASVTPNDRPDVSITLDWHDGPRVADGFFVSSPQDEIRAQDGLVVSIREGRHLFRNAVGKMTPVSETRIVQQLVGRIELPVQTFKTSEPAWVRRRGELAAHDIDVHETFDARTQSTYRALRADRYEEPRARGSQASLERLGYDRASFGMYNSVGLGNLWAR